MQLNAIGGGRYIEVIDGALAFVPKPKRIGPFNTRPRKRRPAKPLVRAERGYGPMGKLMATPGYREWLSREHKHMAERCNSVRGRQRGLMDGVGLENLPAIKKQAEIIAMTEFEELCTALNEHDPVVAYAMKQILIMLNEPGGTRDKHALIRTLLEYRKAKPAAASTVTVTNTQDTWATLISGPESND
ncbi:hypothetical protein ACFZ8E_07500 [Methylobacterium sp. HMF5984]|uniref:hypothetical protein n=1 Tax=Methylobacterium sp. HMF5984 TaxID=3367370 RepID=UPI003851D275